MTDPTIEDPAVQATTDDDIDPDRLVATAEAEEHEAEALVEALEARFVDGDESVGQDTIEKQRGLAAFAKLHVQRAKVKRDRIKAARRTAAAEQLASEASAYSAGVGNRLAKAQESIWKAQDAYEKIANEHDTLVSDWLRRAMALGIPETDGRPLPPAIDGRLARGKGSFLLQVGRRQFKLINGGPSQPIDLDYRRQMLERLRAIDAEVDPVAEDTLFYRNVETAAYFRYSPDSRDLVYVRANPAMVQVSREEALGS